MLKTLISFYLLHPNVSHLSFSFQSPCASFSVIFKIRLQRQRTTQKLFELMENSSSSGASRMKFVLYLFLLFISGLMDVASKQMLADNVPQIKYDVFINFRSRTSVTVFLVIRPRLSIKSKYMPLFVNDKLEKGDEIWPLHLKVVRIDLRTYPNRYSTQY